MLYSEQRSLECLPLILLNSVFSFLVQNPCQLIGKVTDAEKDGGQRERRASDEMAGRHHQRNGHKFGKLQEMMKGQGGLSCCSPWGCKESDMTGQLNNSPCQKDLPHHVDT